MTMRLANKLCTLLLSLLGVALTQGSVKAQSYYYDVIITDDSVLYIDDYGDTSASCPNSLTIHDTFNGLQGYDSVSYPSVGHVELSTQATANATYSWYRYYTVFGKTKTSSCGVIALETILWPTAFAITTTESETPWPNLQNQCAQTSACSNNVKPYCPIGEVVVPDEGEICQPFYESLIPVTAGICWGTGLVFLYATGPGYCTPAGTFSN